MMNRLALIALLSSSLSPWCISAFTTTHHSHRHGSKLSKMTLEATKSNNNNDQERRSFLTKSAMATFLLGFQYSNPASVGAVDVDDFLQTGMVSMPMGVSGQAGKARPETGVFLRDGSEVSRNEKTGDVLAEIVLNAKSDSPTAVLTSFVSPWPLAKGAQFDVECRDSKTGDGAFLAVTSKLSSQNNLADLPSSYFVNQLFSPTGRFSFYGAPTDIKIKKISHAQRQHPSHQPKLFVFKSIDNDGDTTKCISGSNDSRGSGGGSHVGRKCISESMEEGGRGGGYQDGREF
uniref:Uncharacterized protein n=1 Tax=Helicotheca tamesis TaxID=374047 RepID=A0A7S2E3I8_9STRA